MLCFGQSKITICLFAKSIILCMCAMESKFEVIIWRAHNKKEQFFCLCSNYSHEPCLCSWIIFLTAIKSKQIIHERKNSIIRNFYSGNRKIETNDKDLGENHSGPHMNFNTHSICSIAIDSTLNLVTKNRNHMVNAIKSNWMHQIKTKWN